MLEVTKCAPEAALANLGRSLSNFFASRKGKRKGRRVAFPKFKKKGKARDSFYVSNDKFAVSRGRIRLPHIGQVAMTEQLRFCGKLMSATVSRTADHWYVSIQVEDQPIQHKSHVRVGLDLGLKTAVVVSTGKTFGAPRPLCKHPRRLARLNRRLHRKVKGSANRRKAALRVARLHERIGNIRRDWLHKTTTCIARRFSFVAIEDLDVAGMAQAKNHGRAIADVGMGEIGRMLGYKASRHGGRLVKVSRWLPSSKTCRKCGCIKHDLTLKERVFVCDRCGHIEDRDLNASRNTCREGLRLAG
jgi:putative transposase